MTLQGPLRQEIPSSGPSQLPESKAGEMGERQIVRYDPRMADPLGLERMEHFVQERTAMFLRRSLEADRYAAQHLRQYGEGKIFVLLGHSTAGKTSIIKQLRSEHSEWLESGCDINYPSQDADLVRARAPTLYTRMVLAMDHVAIGRAIDNDEPIWKTGISKEVQEDALLALEEARKMGFDGPSQDADEVKRKEPALYARMALALEHREIAYTIFGGKQPQWKPGITSEVQQDAERAIDEAKTKRATFRLYHPEHERIMEEEVIENAMQGKSVIFDPYDEKTFLARMVEKNNFAHLKMGLAYCPFPDLAARVAKRNADALATGQLYDYRNPLTPLLQFCDFYRPARPGETVLDTLHRDEVDQVFENAFKQQSDFLLKRAQEHPSQLPLLPVADPEYTHFMAEHDSLKERMLRKLGFSDPSVNDVAITTSRQGIDYLFRTNVMKPPASSAMISEWK